MRLFVSNPGLKKETRYCKPNQNRINHSIEFGSIDKYCLTVQYIFFWHSQKGVDHNNIKGETTSFMNPQVKQRVQKKSIKVNPNSTSTRKITTREMTFLH